jgi:uncharacterized LabA/DUF88 family protein
MVPEAMHFYPDERIVVLIDGQNLHSTLKVLGMSVDFRKLLDLFRKSARLVRAMYYTTVIVHEVHPLHTLIDWLDYNGFSLVTKPVKETFDQDGRRHLRGDTRVEMSVDAMELAPQVDHIVLVTGHGSFTHLAAALQRLGKRVTVVSSARTNPPAVADELRRQADQFVELLDILPTIGRDFGNAPVSTHMRDQEPLGNSGESERNHRSGEPGPNQGSEGTLRRSSVARRRERSSDRDET